MSLDFLFALTATCVLLSGENRAAFEEIGDAVPDFEERALTVVVGLWLMIVLRAAQMYLLSISHWICISLIELVKFIITIVIWSKAVMGISQLM